MKRFLRQQSAVSCHLKRLMYKKTPFFIISTLLLTVLFLSGCISPKDKVLRATLLKTENATKEQMLGEIDRFAKVNSLRAKVDIKFEDNSYAATGVAEKYKSADGEVVVQRPANILLKVQIPIIKTDIAHMTSDGKKFRVAILLDNSGGRLKKFIYGSNDEDYSVLQKEVEKIENGDAKAIKQNVNAFADIRPQHFTDAMLVRPVDSVNNVYVESTIMQEEFTLDVKKNSPTRWVLRGYYLIDEFHKDSDGKLHISRRFWFDRVGGIRLARQQIFDRKNEIESDITYGTEADLAGNPEYAKLPIRIEVTRPKEKYKMSLTYQTPESVSIGKTYPVKAFELENTWKLPEVDLDQKLKEMQTQTGQGNKEKSTARIQ